MTTQISFAGVLRLATLALLVPVASAYATPVTNADSVSQVLQEVKVHAGQANYDAEILDTFARSAIPWQLHAQRLHEIRGHVNDLFQDFSTLKRTAHSATPQQREAIVRLEPLLQEMAKSLTRTIQDLNEYQNRTQLPPFRARIHSDYLNINKVYRELCKCTDKSSS